MMAWSDETREVREILRLRAPALRKSRVTIVTVLGGLVSGAPESRVLLAACKTLGILGKGRILVWRAVQGTSGAPRVIKRGIAAPPRLPQPHHGPQTMTGLRPG